MKKTAFVFPGQGSQYPGMGESLYDNFPIARQIFDEAGEVDGIKIKHLCFYEDMDLLTQTKYTQPALFTVSYAMFQVFMQEGIEPAYLAGHSLGEITALACAGAIDFKDAVRLVKARGRIMQRAANRCQGRMIAIKGGNLDYIRKVCQLCTVDGDIAVISNYNSPDQIVVSGNNHAVMSVGSEIQKQGGSFTELKVSAPFHSPLMSEAGDEFQEELKNYKFHDFKYQVISNVTAEPYGGKNDIYELLIKHMKNPVLWKDSVDYMISHDVAHVLELGPKSVLSYLIKKCGPGIKAYSYDKKEDMNNIDNLITEITGKAAKRLEAESRNEAFMNECLKRALSPAVKKKSCLSEETTAITLCLAHAICVPSYANTDAEYKRGVLQPYKQIKKMNSLIEKEKRQPTREEVEASFHMLYEVFQTKKVSKMEQQLRFQSICEKLGK